MSEQRKFPLVYQTVNGVAKNVYTGQKFRNISIETVSDANNIHACNRCEVDDCKFRGDLRNLDCEPGIDCLAAE